MSEPDADLIVDLFAGPGGWSEGLRLLGLVDIGIEWDAAACATRAAAGHRTIRADVAAWPLERLVRRVRGLIASPPCQLFSTAGTKVGRGAVDLLVQGIRDLAAGRDTRAGIRAEAAIAVAAGLKAQADADDGMTGPERIVAYQQADDAAPGLAYNACLVLEPARWAFALEPEWIALEQVPAVLPLWQVLARELRARGYRTWCGVLNAADYGVPQTRRRAILMAHRCAPVAAPEPTHAENPVASLFGPELESWVTMADALGWSDTALLRSSQRKADRGTPGIGGYRERSHHSTGGPAPTLTGRARSWELQPGGWGATVHKRRRYRADEEPAPTLAFGNDMIGWRWFELDEDESPSSGNWTGPAEGDECPGCGCSWDYHDEGGFCAGPCGGNRCTTSAPEDLRWAADQPAPTLTGTRRAKGGMVIGRQLQSGEAQSVGGWLERRNDQSGPPEDPDWPAHRPATTVAGRGLIPDPGTNANRFNGSDKSRNDGYRVTIGEAAILQTFHPRYPWQGTMTKQFEQVGNAVPPLLAAHVVHALDEL